jgi:tRNA wybutosine-synthesizing protein 1
MTPWLGCENCCLHCWRAVELDFNKIINKNSIKSPKEFIDHCIQAQRKLLTGFKIDPKSKKKQLSKANQKKYKESLNPSQFAISLSGEPTLYPQIGGLIAELRKQNKSSFLVSNGLNPKVLEKLENKNQLPTQLYITVNMPNKEKYLGFHKSKVKNAWIRLNQSLELLNKIKNKTRTVVRINVILGFNMSEKDIEEFAQLVKKANPMFVEIKAYMSVGFARERIGYDKMPFHKDVQKFAKELVKELKGTKLKILDEKEESRVVLIGKNKKDMKIKRGEI